METNLATKIVSIILAVAISVFPVFVWPVAAQVQDNDLFAISKLERRLKQKFNLSQNDMRRLHPLIKRENENAALTLGYYFENNSEDFLSLWNGVRVRRAEFELSLGPDLTRRQKNSLRAARTEFESRIVNLWLDEYLETLANLLELDSFQISCVLRVFENETEKRARIIVTEADSAVQKNSEWQRLTNERDEYLKQILNTEQYRDYLSLGKPDEGLLAFNF